MSGLWVEWKPLMAPQAMVMNRQGNSVSVNEASVAAPLLPSPSHSSGSWGISTKRHTISATAMKSREKAKRGYTLPMILSMGNMVAST